MADPRCEVHDVRASEVLFEVHGNKRHFVICPSFYAKRRRQLVIKELEYLRLIPSEQIIHHLLPKEGYLGNGAIYKTRFFLVVLLSLLLLFFVNLVKNLSCKVVSKPFDFIKGIHLVVDTLCEAEVLSSGFEMRTEI